VIQERHAAFGVLLPPGVREALADDAGARDGTGKRGHDRVRARLGGLPGRAGGLGGCCGGRRRRSVYGGRTLQVTDLLQRVGLRLLGRVLAGGAGGDLGRCLGRCRSVRGARFRLVLVQALYLFLQDAHRLAERALRGRERRAQTRGGLAAAAAFLERATVLTPDPAQRAVRALAAAQAKVQAGAFGAALNLLAMAEAGPLSELQHARVDLVRAARRPRPAGGDGHGGVR
jgi:hypothetical protein